MRTTNSDISAALSVFVKKMGNQSVDKDQREVRKSVEDFLQTSGGSALQEASSTLTTDQNAHEIICKIMSEDLSLDTAADAYEPSRVSTALSCEFLNQVSGDLKQFAHLQTICEELYSFVYKDFKADNGDKDLRSFLQGMPFFELARSLRVHVTRLEEERKELEAEEAQLVVRRQVRKR